MSDPVILLTNDDGVDSPGLAAAAAAIDDFGELIVVAPQRQMSGMGRSMPIHHKGRLYQTSLTKNGKTWRAYGADASPAQAVQHGLLELAPTKPILAVSGINYGENIGIAVTISGTVGAALEAAAHGIPALAVSLEVRFDQHLSNEASVDFSAAMHFTHKFAQRWLESDDLPDVDVLKIDIPNTATVDTPWRITRLERKPYYYPVRPDREALHEEGVIGYELAPQNELDKLSDATALSEGVISVTPLSLDMTSRIDPQRLENILRTS